METNAVVNFLPKRKEKRAVYETLLYIAKFHPLHCSFSLAWFYFFFFLFLFNANEREFIAEIK